MTEVLTVVGRNGLWLLAPVMIWNVALAAKLPRAFSKDVFWAAIPKSIAIPENLLRFALFALPSVTVIEFDRAHALGWLLFAAGLVIYFASWIALIAWPQSRWSRHAIGFIAPAYTPALWLIGMALMTTSFVGQAALIRALFLALGLAFLAFHITHTALIFRRESA